MNVTTPPRISVPSVDWRAVISKKRSRNGAPARAGPSDFVERLVDRDELLGDDLALALDDLDADIVRLDHGAVVRAAGDGDLELARQELELRVVGGPLAQQFGHRARVRDLVGGGAREVVGGHVADRVARGLDRVQPDIGQRGRGVFIARNAAAVHDYLARFNGAVIAQQYIDGDEFGIFIARMPDQPQVQVLSIVHKTFPQVTGDGQRSLRQLILDDARARLIADTLFARWAEDLQRVPDSGESIALVEIGAHCRGSLFLDATARVTPALVATLTQLADAVPGYAFGRLDLRAPSIEHLQRGDGLRVLELNGVTAESAHIYHPGTPLLVGYAAMFRQWALAFRVGAARARDGAPVTGPVELLRRFVTDLARARQWF